jgi:predicted DNA-binding transcriptional regulator AlpA
VRPELQLALDQARQLPPEELPRLLGDLREVEAVCIMRLASPTVETKDELLEVPEAAHRLGVSPDYLYHHHTKFPFTRRIGRKLLFSSLGLESYLKKTAR